MPDVRRFLPIPYDAIEAFSGPDLLLVVELYRRAHALRWRAYNVTQRSLSTRFGIDARRIRTVLDEVHALELGVVEHGSKRRPTRVSIHCPTRQDSAAQDAAQDAAKTQQNNTGANVKTDDRAAQDAAQDESGPAPLLLRHDSEKRKQDPKEREADLADPMPKWLRNWLRTDGRLVVAAKGARALDVLGALSRTLEGIRGKPGNVVESAGRPILRLWREILADGAGEIELDRTLEELVDPVVLLAHACQRCPDPIFARDVRGEGWEGGRDRSRNIAAICRLAPPGASSGATWQERLEAARAWDRANRPTTSAAITTSPKGSGSTYLQRLDRIAAEGA